MPTTARAASLKSEAGASLADATWLDTHPPSAQSILAEHPQNIALFLDCDGTMLDIAPTPNEVSIPPDLVDLLSRISDGLGGALAILTGRQLAEIDVLLKPRRFIGSGVHGSEMRTAQDGIIDSVAPTLPGSLVGEVLRRTQKLPGIIVEPKGPGIAIHYRLAPHLKDALEATLRSLLTTYPDGLVLSPGRKLFEIVPAGHSKGTALETILALPQFAGRRPIMVGDDVGDIPAFAAATRLGGSGLRVAGEQFGHDDIELESPTHVIDWLRSLAMALQV